MKKIIKILPYIVIPFALSGCGEHFPEVQINTGLKQSYRTITVGQPYIYTNFDTVDTDNGKDLILHFVKEGDE